jgi:hypothetical protein
MEDFMHLIDHVGSKTSEAAYRAIEHKRTMCQIILLKISNEEKIQKLRESILYYNAHKNEKSSNKDEKPLDKDEKFTGKDKIATNKGENSLKKEDSLLDNTSTDRLALMVDFLKFTTAPLKIHIELVTEIADTIKEKMLTPEQKIDIISNLLM